jgi:hypothetical protein
MHLRRSRPFPTFLDTKADLLLEELTMDHTTSPSTALPPPRLHRPQHVPSNLLPLGPALVEVLGAPPASPRTAAASAVAGATVLVAPRHLRRPVHPGPTPPLVASLWWAVLRPGAPPGPPSTAHGPGPSRCGLDHSLDSALRSHLCPSKPCCPSRLLIHMVCLPRSWRTPGTGLLHRRPTTTGTSHLWPRRSAP